MGAARPGLVDLDLATPRARFNVGPPPGPPEVDPMDIASQSRDICGAGVAAPQGEAFQPNGRGLQQPDLVYGI